MLREITKKVLKRIKFTHINHDLNKKQNNDKNHNVLQYNKNVKPQRT